MAFAKLVAVLCLSLPVCKKEIAMKSLLQSFMLLVCLEREYSYCKVCVCACARASPREKKRVGKGKKRETERKRFYNFLPWVNSHSLASPWLLPEMGVQRPENGETSLSDPPKLQTPNPQMY